MMYLEILPVEVEKRGPNRYFARRIERSSKRRKHPIHAPTDA